MSKVIPLAEEARRRKLEAAGVEDLDLTEDGIARFFTSCDGDDWRYCNQWSRWFRWSGWHWQEDRTRTVYEIMREYLAAAGRAGVKGARDAKKWGTVKGAELFARGDPKHATVPEDWDRDPWLLATPAGTVHLHTGQMRAPRREDLITKAVAVGPGGDCPRWLGVLDTATGGDQELIGYLQRLFGYGLTGSNREQMLAFFYGSGANGKGSILNTVTGIAGTYARTAAFETFAERQGERHPADLAALRGARLVVSQEVEAGRRWAETRVKALTGGDPISARFMRGDFFDYVPTFTLIFAGNHKPGLRDVDEAMRRRIHLVPFTVTIPPDERDPLLAHRLRDEWPGILAWMIQGAKDWLARGLCPPARVREASEAYFEEQDEFGEWLSDRCYVGARYEDDAKDLFASWRSWCEEHGVKFGSPKQFGGRLCDRGFRPFRTMKSRRYEGLIRKHVIDAERSEGVR